MRVIYAETEDCTDCLYNKNRICYELSKPVKEVNFPAECPLPTREIVESFTRYISKSDKSTRACGNCTHWERWAYNRSIRTEIGLCNRQDILMFCHCNSDACKHFKEVGK